MNAGSAQSIPYWNTLAKIWAAAVGAFNPVEGIRARAMTVQGWISGDDSREIVRTALSLGENPTIVEVGVFLGRSVAMLAGARSMRGSGKVHCVDPFDCSGEEYSMPFYRAELQASGASTVETAFLGNVKRLKLEAWIQVHKGTSSDIARRWTAPIDLLMLDADHSPDGALAIFEEWEPFLKPGGMLILPNTKVGKKTPGHDGNRRIVDETLRAPRFVEVRSVLSVTFARKAA